MKNPQMITRLLAVATLSVASIAQVYAADLKDQPLPAPLPTAAATSGAPIDATGAAALGATGAATAATPVSDATLKTDVQSALKADKQASTLKLDVKSVDGVVVLNGAVPSTKAATYVIELASSVQGVKGVKNELKVSK